MVEIQAQEYT